ncbi:MULTISPECIES: GntR family transcriptional regulator [Gilliamella]|uniref:GntR family transcriptional regulator n=1 Tax=Gilliamella TaxID=1193503 RepID=UPI0004D4681E|nr:MULTISPECIES: GntR family transcriptional regulator [Gilliamella]KES15876.1 Transcriptional regulator [Gilliamella apis SCGC AB-598-P17]MBI0156321.1 GntR family transcriptional regulator [Gilliamella sp. M0364]OTQ57080.1 GntR family transcriptional regulator [Gilliamella apis]OTQ62828.1 GntR family transcriptional regulator [Gilliamella apis]OTQ63296.1 GntR family transcriptional regulator [Gilliamella apis]
MFKLIELNISEPVNQQVYRTLRRAIITCQVLPGILLSEKDISTQFNVSRQPVREAFIKLAEAGLVKILPQRGTFVTKISVKKVIDGQFIREAVECAIIKRAAQEISDADLLLLEKNLKEQIDANKRKDIRYFLEKDDEFHQILMNVVDCPMAWETVENIKAMMDRVRYLTLEDISPPEDLVKQHEKIVIALKKHDPEMAALALHEHLSNILQTINILSQQRNDWFVD